MEPDRERGTVVRGHSYAVVMGMEPTGRGGLLLGGVAMLPLRWEPTTLQERGNFDRGHCHSNTCPYVPPHH